MTTFIALLRAVNVGGTGKLPMKDLKILCEKAGLRNVSTYIASGNVIFQSDKSESAIKADLESALQNYAGKAVGVMVRSVTELKEILASNPFPQAAPNRTVAIFLDTAPPAGALGSISGKTTEEIQLGKREVFVYYGDGMADSKLKIPAAKSGTSRNMNTVAKLLELASRLD